MDHLKTPHNSKLKITEHLSKLTRAVLVNIETGRFPLTVEDHCGQSDLNDIRESCTGILELSGAAKYEWDHRKHKWVDVSTFSKEELVALATANDDYERLVENVKRYRQEAQEARYKTARVIGALNTLEQELLRRVTDAIEDFERANPAIKLENLLGLIAKRTAGSVEQVQKDLKLQS